MPDEMTLVWRYIYKKKVNKKWSEDRLWRNAFVSIDI